MVVRAEVAQVAERLVGEADRWRAAYGDSRVAVARQVRASARAQRRLVRATGGLGLYRWSQACRRQRILTVADTRLRAGAIRARPAVEAALAERERALSHGRDLGSRLRVQGRGSIAATSPGSSPPPSSSYRGRR